MRYEFNRPFLEAKDYQDNDALAVEATGYALITLFLMEGGGVTFIQVHIRFSLVKKMVRGPFINYYLMSPLF